MKHKIEPLAHFLERPVNEEFYNPYDDKSQIEVKPSHIADKGGMLKPRKEVFNVNRVEYAKRSNGAYTVMTKTQFAKGEIVEIAPIIFVGFEAKAVPRLKDYIFEIDKAKQTYGVVLGYGSLYKHSETPNITFAYNSGNKQMYFIASKFIFAGEELSIDYGKDYWQERSGFGMIAPDASTATSGESVSRGQENESQVQPNAMDLTDANRTRQFSQPNNAANPAVSGVAIKTIGQQ